jgi:flavin-dependent dehydrogenase
MGSEFDYDVLIAGGAIAGSIAAKFLAKEGIKVLMIEKDKTPRNKPCSGIQFGYFEKIMGEKIPPERLCNIQLTKVEMHLPNGFKMTAPFNMLNFMRKPLDDWMNIMAQGYGAEFQDECGIVSAEEVDGGVVSTIQNKGEEPHKIKTKYLIDATGLRPKIRLQLRPQDFGKKSMGATLNYYINGDVFANPNLDPKKLYQFWNMEWNDAMFAWVYTKTLDDGKDYWVVGTGCITGKVKERQTKFYNYIKEKYKLEGEIIKKEGYSSNIDMQSTDRVWLGQGRILMAGDAAGLVDMVRGVGMDAAALSGRLAAKSIIAAENEGTNVLDKYTHLMRNVTKQTKRNQARQITGFKNNDELMAHMKKGMAKMGIGMMFHSLMNKFRGPEKQKLLPP